MFKYIRRFKLTHRYLSRDINAIFQNLINTFQVVILENHAGKTNVFSQHLGSNLEVKVIMSFLSFEMTIVMNPPTIFFELVKGLLELF